MPKKPASSSSAGQIALFQVPDVPRSFKKAVQVVHSKPRAPMSLLQRKVSNSWLKHALHNPPDEHGWWSLRIQDMAREIGFDSNNREYLKDAALELMRIVFEWDVVAGEGKRVRWKASVLFPDVEITSEHMRFAISNQLRDQVLHPEMYALIDMNIVSKFRRAPSLALYEFCVRFERIGRTTEVAWETLRDMLLGESNESKSYAEYKYFKQKVLKPAMAEVNALSDMRVEMNENYQGRRVGSLSFTVHRPSKPQLEAPSDDVQVMRQIGAMVEMGLMQSEARRLVSKYSSQEIDAALVYVKRRLSDKHASRINNPAAYLRETLKNNWAVVEEQSSVTANAPVASATKAKKLLEDYMLEQNNQASLYFKELDPEDQQELINRYNAQQAVASLRLSKKSGKATQSAFFTWLGIETWGHPSSEQLLAFATDRLLG